MIVYPLRFPRALLRAGFAAVLVLIGAAADAAVDRERSQRFYEQALDHFKQEGYSEAVIQLRNALQQDAKNLPARILLGETLLREDQPAAAIKELEMALSLGGDENLILIPLAESFMELAQPERVITGIVPEGHESSVDGELHLIQAAAYTMLGNAKLAEESYLAAGVLLPADPRPLVARAQLALSRGKRDQADQLLNQALELAPESFDVWIFKALALRDLGQVPAALAAFKRALELRPTSERALTGRAALWLDLGETERAKADLDKARDLGLNSLETIYLRTLMLFHQGKFDEGRELLRESADEIKSIKEDVRKKLSSTELMLGVVAYFEGNYEEAAAHLESFLKGHPGHPGAQRYLAASYLGLGEWELAIRVYRDSPNAPLPTDPSALSMLAEAYRSKGDYRSAEKFYETAFNAAPNLAGIGIKLAMSRLDAGKPEAALKELKWFVEKFPDLLEAQVQLARVYVKLGNHDEARATINAALARAGDNPGVHNVASAVFLAAGDKDAAREHLRIANTLDPDAILPQLNLARLDRLEGNIASAESQYRLILDRHPRQVESGLELAQLLLDQGEYKEAGERIERVLEAEPDLFEAHVIKLRAFINQGADAADVRSATYALKKKFPDSPRAALTAGMVYATLGDSEDARVQFRHAVQQAQFDTKLLTAVATEQLAMNDLNGALWALTKALQGNPDDLDAGILKAETLIRLKDFDNAELALADVEQRHGESAALLVKRGDLLMAQGQRQEAIAQYTDAHTIAGGTITARTLFGALVTDGQQDAAITLMKQWLLAHPDDLSSKALFAEALMQMKRFPQARDQYEQLRATGIESVVLLNNLAMVYQALGDPQALTVAEQAHKLAPDAWGVLDTYGWILTHNGRATEGLAMLRSAYARSSTSPEVRYHIGYALMKLGRNAAALEEIEAALKEGRPFLGEDDARKLADELRVLDAESTTQR